jgi:hypothetical protein
MTRFHGNVGYGVTAESPPGSGVWKDTITEIPYFGDIVRTIRRSQAGEVINNTISSSNSISIVADAYANENFSAIRYVVWQGTKWTVPSVEVQAPRLILSLGEVYNDPSS